jgi:hypothetical protein
MDRSVSQIPLPSPLLQSSICDLAVNLNLNLNLKPYPNPPVNVDVHPDLHPIAKPPPLLMHLTLTRKLENTTRSLRRRHGRESVLYSTTVTRSPKVGNNYIIS